MKRKVILRDSALDDIDAIIAGTMNSWNRSVMIFSWKWSVVFTY